MNLPKWNLPNRTQTEIFFEIGQTSLRQSITPDNLQGRTNSTFSILTRGTIPLGALLGGVLAEVIGLREALIAAVIGEGLSIIWLTYARVWSIREAPPVAE